MAKPRGAGISACARPSEARRRAGGNRELRPHEIDAKHLLGHGVLDLKPRIGLDEGEGRIACRGFAVDQKFERAEIVVMRGGRQLFGGVNNARTQAVAQRGTGRDLDELLVATLDGAFTLPQMADGAMTVADDLHLDVARLADQALDIDAVVSEGGLRLGLAACIGFLQLRGFLDEAHAAPAAAGHRLDHDRASAAERSEECFCLIQRGRAGSPLDHGHAAAFGELFGCDLVAEQIERLGRRSDENDPLLRATSRQQRIFAEKAIAGMQRVAFGRLGGGNHRFDIEIGTRTAPAESRSSHPRRAHAATAHRQTDESRR